MILLYTYITIIRIFYIYLLYYIAYSTANSHWNWNIKITKIYNVNLIIIVIVVFFLYSKNETVGISIFAGNTLQGNVSTYSISYLKCTSVCQKMLVTTYILT